MSLRSQSSKVDGAQSYIRWAVSHNFGVIDVNVPEFITVSDPSNPAFQYHGNAVAYASTETDVARKEGEKLAGYLWENYVEPYEFPDGIFLMGAGHAFHAVAKLVSENGMYETFPSLPLSRPRTSPIPQLHQRLPLR